MTLNEQSSECAVLCISVTRRLLALDIGDVRTGVAMSDSTNALASPAAVLTACNKESLLAELEVFVRAYSARVVKEHFANRHFILENGDDDEFIKRASDIEKLSAHEMFECIVIGLPLDQLGNETARAAKVREWGEYVASGVGLRTAFVDERYTTRRMIAADKAMKRRSKDGRASIDARAAAEILQSFIDAKRFTDSLLIEEKLNSTEQT